VKCEVSHYAVLSNPRYLFPLVQIYALHKNRISMNVVITGILMSVQTSDVEHYLTHVNYTCWWLWNPKGLLRVFVA